MSPLFALKVLLELFGFRLPSGQDNEVVASRGDDLDDDLLSLPSRPPLPLAKVPRESLVQRALLQAPAEVRPTLKHAIDIAMTARGPCSLAIAPKASYGRALATRQGARLQTSDTSAKWTNGYMTMRVQDTFVQEKSCVDALHELSERTPDRRWPRGHEAEGLNKDGFSALLGTDGRCLKASVAVMGLQGAPLAWESVSCLHLDALDLMWALSQHGPAAFVLRCAGGVVHVLLRGEDGIVALGTPEPWRGNCA